MTSPEFVPNRQELVNFNQTYADDLHDGGLDVAPSRRLAVVACMDARVDVMEVLGLNNGEAHILRNAGGIITDDVVRSLCLSQRHLGTREIILVHHTSCGLHNVDEEAFRAELDAELGQKPSWALGGFADPFADVAESIHRLKTNRFIAHTDHISGFVFDVTDGLLKDVDPARHADAD